MNIKLELKENNLSEHVSDQRLNRIWLRNFDNDKKPMDYLRC